MLVQYLREDTCVTSQQLCSLAVVVPSARQDEFLSSYYSWSQWVVPTSAMQLPVGADQDGAYLWRIVCMRKFLDEVTFFHESLSRILENVVF